MKRLLLAWTAFLGLAASGSGARATLFDFTYSGSLVNFTIPTTDTYQIVAFGAQGGSASFSDLFGDFVGAGGRGAEIGGDFSLTAGEILQVAVGALVATCRVSGARAAAALSWLAPATRRWSSPEAVVVAPLSYPAPLRARVVLPARTVAGLAAAPTATVAPVPALVVAVGFSAPAAPASPEAAVVVHFQTSPAVSTTVALAAAAGEGGAALGVVVATAAAAVVLALRGVVFPVAVAARSTRAPT